METDGLQQGVCPHCEGVGPVGKTCGQDVCVRRGYCFIPGEYFAPPEENDVDPFLGRRLEDYLIVELLGRGGFGKVYLALQIPILMKAALKLLDLQGLNDEMRQTLISKFENEARALARLAHPNIVKLIKYGFYGELPYLVMEYVEGGVTLTEEMNNRADDNRWFLPAEIKRITDQLLDALEAAHSARIIHRDIKPENLMLQQVPGYPDMLRVLDFGLAKYVDISTSTKTAMGTPEFVAPEVLTGKNIGPWTDLYSVGVMVFKLLSDEYPFSSDNLDLVWSQKLDFSFDPVEKILDMELPAEMHFFLRKSIARHPDDRFKRVDSFREALNKALSQLPEDYSVYGPYPGDADKAGLGAIQKDDGSKRQVDPKKPTDPEPLQKSKAEKPKTEKQEKPNRDAFKRWLKREESRLKRQESNLQNTPIVHHTAFSNPSLSALDLPDDFDDDDNEKD